MTKSRLKHLLVFALVAAAFALRGEVFTAARWIWYPESVKESEHQKRYFVKAVDLAAAPKAGTLNFAADDEQVSVSVFETVNRSFNIRNLRIFFNKIFMPLRHDIIDFINTRQEVLN